MFTSARKQSRLSQWDGRRRSSRGEEPAWQRLLQPPVLLRLATVLATMIVVTMLAYRWGPPLPYRIGEIYPTDLRVRAYFEIVNQPETELAREQALQGLSSGKGSDVKAREAVRQSVPVVVEPYQVGTPLVRRGEPITAEQLMLLQEEHRAFLRSL